MARRNFDVKGIARERILELFKQAEDQFNKHSERSNKYVKMALRLAAKSGIRMPKKVRRSYCRNCKSYLVSGKNSKIRTRNGKLVVSCLVCGSHRRMILKPKF